MKKSLTNDVLARLHSEQTKLHKVLVVLSAVGLIELLLVMLLATGSRVLTWVVGWCDGAG